MRLSFQLGEKLKSNSFLLLFSVTIREKYISFKRREADETLFGIMSNQTYANWRSFILYFSQCKWLFEILNPLCSKFFIFIHVTKLSALFTHFLPLQADISLFTKYRLFKICKCAYKKFTAATKGSQIYLDQRLKSYSSKKLDNQLSKQVAVSLKLIRSVFCCNNS